jgi:hypothetical protein
MPIIQIRGQNPAKSTSNQWLGRSFLPNLWPGRQEHPISSASSAFCSNIGFLRHQNSALVTLTFTHYNSAFGNLPLFEMLACSSWSVPFTRRPSTASTVH